MVSFSTDLSVTPAQNNNKMSKDGTKIKKKIENNHPRPWCGAANGSTSLDRDPDNKEYHYGSWQDKEKTPMCQIAELCRFNKIKHEYKLMDESGPAHKKMFTVQLVFSQDEKFEGTGGSIKKAQQAAAAVALKETNRTMPPMKRENKKKPAASSPSVLLRHAIQRLGLPEPDYKKQMIPIFPPSGPRIPLMPASSNGNPHYPGPPRPLFSAKPFIISGNGPMPIPSPHMILSPMSPPYEYPPCVHPFIPPPNGLPIPPPIPQPGAFLPRPIPQPLFVPHGPARPVHVTLSIGPEHPLFRTTAPSFTQAKENCASQALTHLGPLLAKLDQEVKEKPIEKLLIVEEEEDTEEKNEDSNSSDDENERENEHEHRKEGKSQKPKSVVSRMHEYALQLKLNVRFENLSEDGPAHNRHYIVRCHLNGPNHSISAEGHGKNKKTAKQEACRMILEQIQDIDKSPLLLAQTIYKNDRKNSMSKESKRKTIVKDKKMDPEYGHQINPVSRLMQIAQAQGSPDPKFELIREQGQNRYKEFIVEVLWNGLSCQGTGPNKRLAKRAAAENILSEIGYVKPLPAPGKSLLKKRGDEMVIGVFDPNEVVQQEEWNAEITVEMPEKGSDESSEVSPTQGNERSSPNGGKRKVTFSSQVSACPPPDDSSYPSPEIAPLKTDDVAVVAKLTKRDRKNKRVLTSEQIEELSLRAREFLSAFNQETKAAILPTKGDPHGDSSTVFSMQSVTARRRLEALSEQFKFSLQFCHLPASAGSDNLALATMGLENQKALVHKGIGSTAEEAADCAALDALKSLAALSTPPQ
ncbi:unnamed protein product, partial [Mesorhabditis belari]|uniref:DRBM domain-containing protein n=1 Tax=Mesorhabditis belari TaxID=2138241 RepID=A0AAF3EYH9_9BILA